MYSGVGMFGKPSLFKEYARLIRQLKEGERRPAQHERPGAVTDKGFEICATAAVHATFDGFEYFAALLNQNISDPWTVEETGDTLVNDPGSDSPELGRTYLVYYNGVRLGRIQVTDGCNPDGFWEKSVEWHQENRAARVIVDVDYLRFVSYHDAISLISMVELFVGRFEDNAAARFRAKAEATAALTGYLWQVQRAEDYVPSFDHTTEGPYDLLNRMTEEWKERGIDPFERWNGDRRR